MLNRRDLIKSTPVALAAISGITLVNSVKSSPPVNNIVDESIKCIDKPIIEYFERIDFKPTEPMEFPLDFLAEDKLNHFLVSQDREGLKHVCTSNNLIRIFPYTLQGKGKSRSESLEQLNKLLNKQASQIFEVSASDIGMEADTLDDAKQKLTSRKCNLFFSIDNGIIYKGKHLIGFSNKPNPLVYCNPFVMPVHDGINTIIHEGEYTSFIRCGLACLDTKGIYIIKIK